MSDARKNGDLQYSEEKVVSLNTGALRMGWWFLRSVWGWLLWEV